MNETTTYFLSQVSMWVKMQYVCGGSEDDYNRVECDTLRIYWLSLEQVVALFISLQKKKKNIIKD